MIPSIKAAQAQAKAETQDSFTIACCQCKAPLWKISDMSKYGTRWSAVKTPFPGVPSYDEYWAKDQKTALRTDCPKCFENYFQVIKSGEITIPKIYSPELDGV